MNNKKLIITADDYGMCGIVNQAIEDCMLAGIVSSTNVIVNMGNFSCAKNLRERFPNVSIGIHWNITSGKPVSEKSTIPSLVDENGLFFPLKEFQKRYNSGLILDRDIKTELLNQYLLFCSICGNPDYWNTHQNSAINFKSFNVFNSVAHELGITRTRSFRRVYVDERRIPGGFKGRIIELCKKIVFEIWFGHIIPRKGTILPDGRLVYFDDFQKTSDLSYICERINWGKKEIVELVVHPAISPNHPFFGNLTDMRVLEWKMFSSEQTKNHLHDHNIQIVNFNHVNAK